MQRLYLNKKLFKFLENLKTQEMLEEWYKISSQPRKYTEENKQKYWNISNVIEYTEVVYIYKL